MSRILQSSTWLAFSTALCACAVDLPGKTDGAFVDTDCAAAELAACDDGNICTVDGCTTLTGCSHKPADSACDDGDPCTTDERCVASKCMSEAKVCDHAVTTVADSEGGGSCSANSCTLRSAIEAANGAKETGTDEPIRIAFTVSGALKLASPLPAITGPTAIDGSLQATGTTAPVTLDGGGKVQLLTASCGLTLRRLRLIGGKAKLGGAVFATKGTLDVADCHFENNSATEGGGAIRATDPLEIRRCRFVANKCQLGGGGVDAERDVNIYDTEFVGNESGALGGGLEVFSGGVATLRSVSFVNNKAATGGGALVAHDVVSAQNCTFDGNTSPGGPRAILASRASKLVHVTVRDGGGSKGWAVHLAEGSQVLNSVIGGPGPDPLCAGGANVSGSWIEDGSCGAKAEGEARFGALGYNGGFTRTLPILAGSPAINIAAAEHCVAGTATEKDQRGVQRPQFGACDAGAFEQSKAECPAGTLALPPARCVNIGSAAIRVGLSATTADGVVPLFIAPPGNLLVNGGAETGDYTGWEKNDGGDGWALSKWGVFGGHGFVASYVASSLTQAVDLRQSGLTAAQLQAKDLHLRVGVFGFGFGDPNKQVAPDVHDRATLQVEFLRNNGTQAGKTWSKTMQFPLGGSKYINALTEVFQQLPSFATGLRFQVTAVDTEFNAGNYGPLLDGMHVTVGALEMRLANEDEAFGQWQAYAPRVDGWKLKPGSGKRTVRVEFREAVSKTVLIAVSGSVEAL